MLRSLILIFALCADICMASLTYGANRVHADWGKVVLLNGICSGCLGLALGLGSVMSSVLPGDVTRAICFVSPSLLRFIKFPDYNIRACINRHCRIHRNLSFSLSGLKVVVNIYKDPVAAGVDDSQSPGWRETVFLALAMPIDNLATGTMAVLLDIPMAVTLALSFIVGVCMMCGGLWPGRKVTSHFRCGLSWISGVLLMTLALMKVLP